MGRRLLLTCGWVFVNAHELTERWEGVHPVTLTQVVIGTVLVAAVLEASRRSVGFWFFVTTLLFMAYLVLAPWLPGFLRSPRAYSYPQLIEMFYLYADEGVLGSLTGISSNILMIFILFASFMLHSGVGPVLHGHLDRAGRTLPRRARPRSRSSPRASTAPSAAPRWPIATRRARSRSR